MLYSLTGICALLICIIINKNILFKNKKDLPNAYRVYNMFLYMIMAFFISDSIWGIFYEKNIIDWLYADTIIFFIFMTLSVVFWTFFVGRYVNKSRKLNNLLYIGGVIILVYAAVVIIINFFNPIMFGCEINSYAVNWARYLLFLLQIVLYLSVAIAALILFIIDKQNKNRYRCLSICLSSGVMALSILGQTFFPLLPVYSIGSIISICFVHIFVVSSEKEEVLKQLAMTKTLVSIDSLTGARSKHAFIQLEEKMDELIRNNEINNFSIVVFDINDLKVVNDTKGHEAGDICIKDSYQIITDVFKKSEIYRFGGDEFVCILTDEDYDNKEELYYNFNKIIDNNVNTGRPVVSIGMADFNINVDKTFNSVFIRADEKMYIRKKFLKSTK